MHPLHEKALRLAETYRTTESELLDILMRMQAANLLVAMGYSGIYSYCTQALKLSEAQACYFSKVARKSVEVPALKQAIEEGVLTLSQARRIEPVITLANSNDWIGKAAELPQRELERAVTEVNPRAICPEKMRPLTPQRSELRMTVSIELEKQLRQVQDLVSQKTAKPASLEDALIHRSEKSMDEFFAFLGDKRSKAVEVAVMDMWKPFRNSTKINAPQAAILFDKFHILRHLGEALDKIRKQEYARLNDHSGRDPSCQHGTQEGAHAHQPNTAVRTRFHRLLTAYFNEEGNRGGNRVRQLLRSEEKYCKNSHLRCNSK
jgi:hypothetical protein